MSISNFKHFVFFVMVFLFVILKSSTAFGIHDTTKTKSSLLNDSSKIQIRQPDEVQQQKLMDNPDYQYDRGGPAPKTWWDRFKEWIGKSIERIFDSSGGRLGLSVLPYIIVFAVIIIVILLLLKNDLRSVFYGKSAALTIDFKEFQEDIHNLNFDDLIADAVTKKDYRRAVRLHFLKLLKELTDKNLITWQIDKTNNDYSIELSKSTFSTKFKELALVYEYIWYGDLQLDETNFKSSIAKFKEFKINA